MLKKMKIIQKKISERTVPVLGPVIACMIPKAIDKIKGYSNKSLKNLKLLQDILIKIVADQHIKKRCEAMKIVKEAMEDLNIVTIFDISFLLFSLESKVLNDISIIEKFTKFMKDVYECVKQGDCNDIVKKRHELMEILEETVGRFDIAISNSTETDVDDYIYLAITYLNLGIMYSDCVEDFQQSEEHLLKCLKLLDKIELNSKAILPVIRALHQLYKNGERTAKAVNYKLYLERAEEVYEDYVIAGGNDPDTLYLKFIIDIEVKEKSLTSQHILDELHVMSLSRLKNFYENIKQDKHKQAIYCHRMLDKLLYQSNVAPNAIVYSEWCINAAKLSQYFTETQRFTQARHVLATASYMLHRYKNILTRGGDVDMSLESEVYNYTYAIVAAFWGKYGVSLLTSSIQILQASENKNPDETSYKRLSTTIATEIPRDVVEYIDILQFANLVHDLEQYTSQVTDKYVSNYNDASLVFTHSQTWLRTAKEFLRLDHRKETLDSCKLYQVQIAQDASRAYKCLTFYETNKDKKIELHKRRIEVLEDIIEKINFETDRDIYREMSVELGVVYSNILNIKLHGLSIIDKKGNVKVIKNFKYFVENSIRHLQSYLNSLDGDDSATENESCSE